jgi:hypothetical protein
MSRSPAPDHLDPATTAHLIRRTISQAEREPPEQAPERNEMTNEEFVRQAYAIADLAA